MEHISETLCRYKGYNFFAGLTTPEYLDSLHSFQIRDSDIFLVTYPKSGQYKGYNFTMKLTSAENIESLQSFEIREDDVFLVTYPKSGTIWTQQIIISICKLYGGLPEYHNNHNHMPWLEFNPQKEDRSKRPSPRLFTSHLIPSLMPPDIKDKKSKVIYVMRNPKDVMKSCFEFRFSHISFEEFFERFMEGNVGASSWFDHIRAWLSVSDQCNILYLKYEDMILDLRTEIVKICNFLGKNLSDADVDKVVENSSFDTMKKDAKANYALAPIFLNTGGFMRKGRTGDWKNTLTAAQSKRVEQMLEEKLGDMNLKFIWE